ncbi:MAG TPA: hypothetical protein VLB87_03465, partial [Pyrinomonadaceae bacterium]|nr:hypothetical protein [Pyrinomonadaceae bacterium]
MSENNIPPNDDASNLESTPDTLDTSGKGGPHIPRSPIAHPIDPATGGSGPHLPPPPSMEEFTVEVELVPGVKAEDVDALLLAINAADLSPGAIPESDFARVARTHRVIKGQHAFTREQVERSRARIDVRRNQIAEPEHVADSVEGVSDQMALLDRLPPLTNYLTLRFPAGTSVKAVLAELKALPQVKQVVEVPEAESPSLPTDVLIGSSGSEVQVDPNTNIEKQW